MTAEVTPLFTIDEEGKPDRVVQSIDVGFVTPIGDTGRQLTLRTFVDRETTLEEQKRVVRNMLVIADVERAHYELQDLLGQLVIRERALKRAQEDVDRIAKKNEGRRGEIEVELTVLKTDMVNLAKKHEEEFRAKRSGTFKPSQSQQNEIAGHQRDIDKLEAELKTLNEAQDSERRDVLTALARGRQDLATCKEEIVKRRSILGLPQDE